MVVRLDEVPDGYASMVHAGPLKPVKVWGAPAEFAVWNLLVFMLISLMVTLMWILIAVLVHVGLIACWWYDEHFLPDLLESLKYMMFLGAE
jgi:type IV secretory pathway VirB3-like protein